MGNNHSVFDYLIATHLINQANSSDGSDGYGGGGGGNEGEGCLSRIIDILLKVLLIMCMIAGILALGVMIYVLINLIITISTK